MANGNGQRLGSGTIAAGIPATVSFVLQRPLLPLLNRTNDQHWSLRHKRKRVLADRVAYEAGVRPLPQRETRKMKVTIERFCTRLPDHDNHVGGCKELVDVLKSFRLLADDDPAHIEEVVVATKVAHRKDERTEVRIEAV